MKLWGGRFKQKTDPKIEEFTKSIDFDYRLAFVDIDVNKAQAKALLKAGLISKEESEQLLSVLDKIEEQIDNDTFEVKDNDEDIHSAIERSITESLGDTGAKIHSGRSRNDQVNTDLRLFIKDEIDETVDLIIALQTSLIEKSEQQIDQLMPGYTHLQRAQPVMLSHHLMAYFWMLERDKNRLEDCLKRVDVLPLGSAALAGTTLEIDQVLLADELGFSKITDNSLDSVSDRDFVIEFLSCLAITQTHLSRLAEEIILWTSSEFSFAMLPDSLATGSSMMPHKKNPDPAELIRGKTGRVYGSLVSILTTMKGLPLSYNRDLQEDKEVLFDATDTVQDCLDVMSLIIEQIGFNNESMSASVSDWPLFTTDLMEYLVSSGEPIRHAHSIMGQVVAYCMEQDKSLNELTDAELGNFSDKLNSKALEICSPAHSVNLKKSTGSTSKNSVIYQINKAKNLLRTEDDFLS